MNFLALSSNFAFRRRAYETTNECQCREQVSFTDRSVFRPQCTLRHVVLGGTQCMQGLRWRPICILQQRFALFLARDVSGQQREELVSQNGLDLFESPCRVPARAFLVTVISPRCALRRPKRAYIADLSQVVFVFDHLLQHRVLQVA